MREREMKGSGGGGGAAGEVEIGVWLVRGIVKAVEETDNEGSGKGSLWFSDVPFFPPREG